jgi:hypothetical protein
MSPYFAIVESATAFGATTAAESLFGAAMEFLVVLT